MLMIMLNSLNEMDTIWGNVKSATEIISATVEKIIKDPLRLTL